MREDRRLLLVTTSLARGGAERQVVDLAVSFRGRGWAVCVVSMTTPTDHLDELVAAGVEVTDLAMQRGRPTPLATLRYLRLIRRWRPDVIHSHMVHANLLARLGRVAAPSIPVVCTVHSVIEGRRWREIAYRVTDPLATTTTAVSRAATERYIRVGAVPRGRISYVPNGFDFSRTHGTARERVQLRENLDADNGFLWLNVGRLVSAKGQDVLLHAMVMLRRARPDARLAIAGEGADRPALERLIAVLGLVGHVILLGERRDVPDLMDASDGFVLSSRWEGLPMVLLEAAGHELPIVSTDVGGCREVAVPEEGAVLTAVDASSLAAGMLRVMELPAQRRGDIGRALNIRARAEFDLAQVVARWEAIYASALTGRHPPSRAAGPAGPEGGS